MSLAVASAPASAQSVYDTYAADGDFGGLPLADYYAKYPDCRFLVRLDWTLTNEIRSANADRMAAQTDEERAWQVDRMMQLTKKRKAIDALVIECGHHAEIIKRPDIPEPIVAVNRGQPPISAVDRAALMFTSFMPSCQSSAFEPICPGTGVPASGQGQPAASPNQAAQAVVRTNTEAQQRARDLGTLLDLLNRGEGAAFEILQRQLNQAP